MLFKKSARSGGLLPVPVYHRKMALHSRSLQGRPQAAEYRDVYYRKLRSVIILAIIPFYAQNVGLDTETTG